MKQFWVEVLNFFLGGDAVATIVAEDLVAHVKTLGGVTKERNIIDIEPELDSTTEEKMAGMKKAVTFTVEGNFRAGQDNLGYDKIVSAYEAGRAVKFGVAKSTGYGFGGLCLVGKVEDSDATVEGQMTWTAEITTTGELEKFVVPVFDKE